MNHNNNRRNEQMTLSRLQKEYQLCSMDQDLKTIGCIFGLCTPGDMFTWRVTMVGPNDSPYKGGIFTINIIFPKNYPHRGAEFRFMNKIYHLNVDLRNGDSFGHISVSPLNEWRTTGKVRSKPCYGVKQALFDIFCLFYNQGCGGCYDEYMAEEYVKNRKKFDETARKWTLEYANLN